MRALELRDQRRRTLEERLRRRYRGAEARLQEEAERRDQTIGTRRLEKQERITTAQQRKQREHECEAPPLR